MTPDEQKTIDQLIRAVNKTSSSPKRVFWLGVLHGIGSGIGATIGLSILVGASIYFFKISGLDQAFHTTIETLQEVSDSLRSTGE